MIGFGSPASRLLLMTAHCVPARSRSGSIKSVLPLEHANWRSFSAPGNLFSDERCTLAMFLPS